ncbi:MAG: IS3 family transposase, partial [Candidatus Omnitrophica bacterium]|nr:IS3 family transposase [Candidatus Omnitrophota bacterium]
RALEVSRSGYYAYRNRPKSQRRIDNEKLLIEIRRVFVDNESNYGSPRIWDELNNKQGVRCSENRIARVMRESGIVAVQKRKFRVTTNSKHNHPVWPNVLSRNFIVEKPNAVWVSDITYIWTFEGWLYVAAILDLFSRGIVGLAMDKTIADTLTTQAMRQAILRRDPPKGLICHTDRGSQYAGNAFKSILAQREFIGSMSRKGDCWDNAVAESFFHTLKVELIHRNKFRTREEAKRKIFEYVEVYYNRKRAHSTLGFLSPFEFEKRAALT